MKLMQVSLHQLVLVCVVPRSARPAGHKTLTLTCNMVLAVIFYDFFKLVNRSLSLLVGFLILGGTAVESVNLVNPCGKEVMRDQASFFQLCVSCPS